VLEKHAALNGAAKCEIDLRISRCVYHFSSRILNRRREAGADGVGSRPMWMESYRFTALIVKRAAFSCHPENSVGSRLSACSEKHFRS